VYQSVLGGRTVHTVVEQGTPSVHFFYCCALYGMMEICTRYALSQVDCQKIGFKKTAFVGMNEKMKEKILICLALM